MRLGALVIVLPILLVSIFGAWHAMTMDGQMSGCPLMTYADSLCGMDPVEHLVLWQRLFTATPHRAFHLLAAIFVLGAILFQHTNAYVFTLRNRARYQLHRRLALAFTPLDPLKRALAQGILHPKIYG